MADWYVSSVTYNALPVWVASTAYTVGQIIRPTAPAASQQMPQRCTTAGTSGTTEAGWSSTIGNTTTQGTAVFTNVAGNGTTWGWNAAFGNLLSTSWSGPVGYVVAGDRVFVSSDHVETFSTGFVLASPNTAGVVQIISVNRAGSVPPVAADELAGATITVNTVVLEGGCNQYWQGFTFNWTASSVYLASSYNRSQYFRNCTITLSATPGRIGANNNTTVTFDNTTIQFGATAQGFGGGSSPYSFEFRWINTPSAVRGATIPVSLFNTVVGAAVFIATCRGVDLSAVTTSLVNPIANATQPWNKILLDSCRIASGVNRYGPNAIAAATGSSDEVELVNCFDGTNILSERHTYSGDLTTSKTTTLVGGAQDDVGLYSLQMVTRSNSDAMAVPLDSFWLDVENAAIGASHTATVEVISSLTLTNRDISLLLEYMSTSGSSLAVLANSRLTALATSTNLPTSSASWNSPPATPVAQQLQVSFTPQQAGRLRGQVRLGRPSTTVYVNPQIAVT